MAKFRDKVTGKVYQVPDDNLGYMAIRGRGGEKVRPDLHQKPWFQHARWEPAPDDTPVDYPEPKPDHPKGK